MPRSLRSPLFCSGPKRPPWRNPPPTRTPPTAPSGAQAGRSGPLHPSPSRGPSRRRRRRPAARHLAERLGISVVPPRRPGARPPWRTRVLPPRARNRLSDTTREPSYALAATSIARLKTSARGSNAASARKATSASSFDRRSMTFVSPAARTASTRSGAWETRRFRVPGGEDSRTFSARRPRAISARAEGRQGAVHQLLDRDPESPRFEDAEDPQQRVRRRRRYGFAVPWGSGRRRNIPQTMSLSAIARPRRPSMQVVGLPLRQVMLEHLISASRRSFPRSAAPSRPAVGGTPRRPPPGEIGLAGEACPPAILRLRREAEGGDELRDVGHPLDLLQYVPMSAWKRTFFTRLGRLNSGFFRSSQIEELASERRARRTRSFPATTTDSSGTTMFDTKANPWEQRSARVLEDEVFLVVPHRGDEDLPRER